MGNYRPSRNIEASIIDFLKPKFQTDWSSENVEKSFARIFSISLPSICIRCGETGHDRIELGSNSTVRNPQIIIDIFAENDGQRLDIKDWLISQIKSGLSYYTYEIENGQVKTKIESGRIRILDFTDIPIDLNVDKNTLDVHERYRHRITLSVSLGKVEE